MFAVPYKTYRRLAEINRVNVIRAKICIPSQKTASIFHRIVKLSKRSTNLT